MTRDSNLPYSPRDFFELAGKTASTLLDENASSFAADLPNVESLSLHELAPSLLPIVNSIKSV